MSDADARKEVLRQAVVYICPVCGALGLEDALKVVAEGRNCYWHAPGTTALRHYVKRVMPWEDLE